MALASQSHFHFAARHREITLDDSRMWPLPPAGQERFHQELPFYLEMIPIFKRPLVREKCNGGASGISLEARSGQMRCCADSKLALSEWPPETTTMAAPGYYKINHRAVRFRERVRMHGWRRGFRAYWAGRFLPPTPGSWMPGTWVATECKREDLSENFWLATKPHRKDFEELGFAECRFSKSDSLNPNHRDSGTVSYLDPTRRYFGLLLYLRMFHPAKRQEINQIIIAFTAVFENGTFSCTNTTKTFDRPDDGSEVVRLNSYDVKFIYQQFLQGLKKREDPPRQFADLESLRQWFDARQLNDFEDRVRRGLFVPMAEEEVAAAKARLQSGAPPIPRPRRRLSLSWALWLAIVAFIFLLEFMHQPLRGSGRTDTMEFRGQQFKLRKAYATWDDYKEDPNNLDTNELDRIEQVMTTAKVPATFQDQRKFMEFMTFELTFPGYGASSIDGPTDDGSKLDLESVEIPQRDKDRAVVVREADGQMKVVDDFVYSTATNDISRVELTNQTLRYYDAQNHLLREKHL